MTRRVRIQVFVVFRAAGRREKKEGKGRFCLRIPDDDLLVIVVKNVTGSDRGNCPRHRRIDETIGVHGTNRWWGPSRNEGERKGKKLIRSH